MAVADPWTELHRTRFRDLPLDCGNRSDPGVIYSEDLRDWSDKATTPDQHRIETYIDRYDLRDKRVLHIGIGNSGLARRFHRRIKQIVGTTIDEPEMKVARSLGLPNYAFVLHNKFAGGSEALPSRFDFIIDNNPSSPCCCLRHLGALFSLYAEKLAPDGQVVTDLEGLEWVPEGSNPRWSFDFDDFAAAGAAAGFSAFRINKTVYVLSRLPLRAPDASSLLRHRLRRAAALPGQIVRNGPRRLNRMVRTLAKRVLNSTVPWALPARYRSDR